MVIGCFRGLIRAIGSGDYLVIYGLVAQSRWRHAQRRPRPSPPRPVYSSLIPRYSNLITQLTPK